MWFLLLAACTSDPSDPESAADATETGETGVTGITDTSMSVYEDLTNYVCHPDLKSDGCRSGLDVTAVASDGTTTLIPHEVAVAPSADCFYVYPTVSADPTPNADRADDGPEGFMTQAQAGPYSRVCAVIAPLYQQVSIAGLFSPDADPELAYADVLAAFEATIERSDRPFLLIGHSQGTHILTRLLAERIEGNASLHNRLVAAHFFGGRVHIPTGADIGASFVNTPLCRSQTDTGCVLHYVTYQDDAPPSSNALFGRPESVGTEVACVNPAAMTGGTAILRGRFPVNTDPSLSLAVGDEVGPYANRARSAEITTPFYSVPGLFSGQCVSQNGAQYLQVTVNADPADPRADDIQGDLILPGWGLHLVDIAVASDDLVDLARRQIDAFGG